MLVMKKILPNESLKNHVKYFWVLEKAGYKDQLQTFNIFADGLPGILFHHHNGNAVIKEQNRKLPISLVYGQTTKFYTNYTNQEFLAVGVCFYPTTLRALVRTDPASLTNSSEALNDIAGFNLNERLLNAPNVTQIIKELSLFLQSRLFKASNPDLVIIDCISKLNKYPSVRLKTLQDMHHLGERQFERRFKQVTGLSPFQFGKVTKFQRAVSILI